MQAIPEALMRALRDMTQPRIISLIIWPVLLAIALWAMLLYLFWHPLLGGLQDWLAGLIAAANYFNWNLSWLSNALSIFLLFALLILFINVTAVLITSVFAMPVLLRIIGARDYADVEIRRGGSTWGSVKNALIAVAVFTPLWLITLPLWLIPPLAVVVPLLLSAYLNQRLFRYDALSDHASAEEYKVIVKNHRGTLWLLGLLVAFVQFIPLANLIAPVFIGLAYIHYTLGRLRQLRATSANG
jgi:CysZ protein